MSFECLLFLFGGEGLRECQVGYVCTLSFVSFVLGYGLSLEGSMCLFAYTWHVLRGVRQAVCATFEVVKSV